MKNINTRPQHMPPREALADIKARAAALAHSETTQGKSELQQARDKVLCVGNATTTALKRSVNASRLKTYNLEIQLLEETILLMQDKLDNLNNATNNDHTALDRQQSAFGKQRLHAAIHQAERKVEVRRSYIQKLPLQSEINKYTITTWR